MAIKGRVVGVEAFKAKLKELGEAAAADNLEAAVRAGGLLILNAAKQNAPKRTRTLGRSLSMETVEKRGDYVLVEIGTNLEYAAIHEFGGTITPKEKQFLAIPLTPEARQYVSPTLYPEKLRAVFAGGGSGVLVDAAGEAQYALTKSATIPAAPYLRPAFDENAAAAQDEVGRVLKVLIEQVAE